MSEKMECSHSGCVDRSAARGLCQRHYDRARYVGNLPPTIPLINGGLCKVDGCVRGAKGRGICQLHLDRQREGMPDWDTRPLNKQSPHSKRSLKYDYQRSRRLLLDFGITVEQYDALYQTQDGLCKICGKPCATGKALAVDHDHETGVVRGLLCTKCNVALGQFGDDINLLASAIVYLSYPAA